ncbi:hypothetical protein [Skermania piniformis]|uniref:Secreted protein n=1 Tax=Skermania pinensis TaxID=39122 RepID=A0ABX8S9Q4_9ACTN|nr:hypothetical protein [Skermania piniformis]QXQ12451.1 hypothetical protein KV203_10635 [Skermania piniformis]
MKTAARLAVAAAGVITATVALTAGAADSRTESDAGQSVDTTTSTTLAPPKAAQPVTGTQLEPASTDSDSAAATSVGPCTFASSTRLDEAAAADPVADRHGGVGFDTARCVTDPSGTAWAVAWNGAHPPVGGLFRFVPTATRWELLELGSLGDCVPAHGVPPEIAVQLPGC